MSYARTTPRGLTDDQILVLYREAKAILDAGNVSRLEEVLTDWSPAHIDRFRDMDERTPA